LWYRLGSRKQEIPINMLKNYLVVAWRNLLKHKSQSFINISGLAVGMAVALLIGLWIADEWTYDMQNPHYRRIALVAQHLNHNGDIDTWMTTPYPLAEELRKHYGSDFNSVVLGGLRGEHEVDFGQKKLTTTGGFYEAPIVDMLDLKMIKGTRDNLKEPSNIFVSASTARAYFGSDDPMGKTLRFDNAFEGKVGGVYEDLPFSSSFGDLGFIGNWKLLYDKTDWIRTIQDPWRPNAFQVYVQLNDHSDFASASYRIKDAKLKNVNPNLAKHHPQLFLFPMSKWHLYSEFKQGVNTGGRIQYVRMFGIIGVFVLLLACINFMNLSTARSEGRAREVGIRKAIGSLRTQLIWQFFSESFLVAVFAFGCALVLVRLSLPFFNEISAKQMTLPWDSPGFWGAGLLFVLVTGLVAGSYPAFYLSSFRPVKVLKGVFRAGRKAAIPRKALVVLQFTVSVALIIGTLIVYMQIQFAKDLPVGYNRNGLVSIPVQTPNIHSHFDAIQRELIEKGAVVSMAEGAGSPVNIYNSSSGFSWPGKDPGLATDIINFSGSWDYGKTVGWQLAEGRDFSRQFATDTQAVLLNEAAVRFMGLKHPVNETITADKTPLRVIGVLKDIVMGSPYDQVRPCVYFLNAGQADAVIARLNPAQSASQSLAIINNVFKKYDPEEPFNYKFTDAEYAEKFDNEQRVGKLAGCFAALAIFISCMGLFGMSAYMAEQRTKEIGVRKVLGASVINLWGLLSKDFVVLVLLSLVIAIPVAWWFMQAWLLHYHNHTTITWWTFALPSIGALLITLVTISFQSVKAATSNPVKSLRSE
jgi:putative ABC transport system permease protein